MGVSMERNDELIDAVLDYIEAHPEEWDQGVWANACGTQACFAGRAMLLSGYTLTLKEEADCGDESCDLPSCHGPEFIRPSGQLVAQEDEEADMLLGWTAQEGNRIYYRNYASPAMLRRRIDEIRGRE